MMMGEGVRTLFIAGLPRDTSERELHLLFYEGGAAEAVTLQRPSIDADPNSRRGQCTAFVQFSDVGRAHTACNFAKGMQFDLSDPNSSLRVEFAKQDFKRMPLPMHAPKMPQMPQGLVPPSMGALLGAGMKRTLLQALEPAALPQRRPAQQAPGASCTLFVGALGELVTQDELLDYVSSQGGFLKLSMKGEGTNLAVGWAEYTSPDYAQVALMNLKATPLATLGKPPNLEIARSETVEGRADRATRPRVATSGAAISMLLSAAGGLGGASASNAPAYGASARTSSTVFLGNIDAHVEEEEIEQVAASQDGLLHVSCRGIGRPRATAWAQYDNPDCAARACEALRDIAFPSMGRPANVEMSRSDMKKPQ